MRTRTLYAKLQPGDIISRQMNRWEVISIGEHLPHDKRVPVHVRCIGPRNRGQEKTWNLRGDYPVWAERP